VRLEKFIVVVRGGRHCEFGASRDEVAPSSRLASR
jgi:hypothetical protein